MSLAIEIGLLADLIQHDPQGAEWMRQSFAQVNQVLAERGLATHDEPATLPPLPSRAGLHSYPYSFLHHLRRFYARAVNDPAWTPTPLPEGQDPAQDPVVMEETYKMRSHLLCHSDAEGFYLPLDFHAPIFDDTGRIPGGVLGSSYRLREELASIAPRLNIILIDGQLAGGEVGKIKRQADRQTYFWIEKSVWLSLFEAARLSIEHGLAICFA
jgi:hypothetical protein